MSHGANLPFSQRVKAEQERRGSRAQYKGREEKRGWPDRMTPELAQLVGAARSFYLGTASADGQPYIQHRGGPPGFLSVLDDKTLGFADYGGNKQFITLGNLAENPRAIIFMMDYARRLRIKIWGRARVIENDDHMLQRLSSVASGPPERCILLEIDVWDRNCHQHIPHLLPAEDVETIVRELQGRINDLEAENARLRGGISP